MISSPTSSVNSGEDMLEIDINDMPLEIVNERNTCVRRTLSSEGVVRFDRAITGQRLPRAGISADVSLRVVSPLLSAARRVDVGGVGLRISLV